jgi:hexosaminidase
MKKILLLIALAFSLPVFAQEDPYMGIIPAPVSVKKTKGVFRFTPETIILVDSPDNKSVRIFKGLLLKAGYSNTVTDINTVDRKRWDMKNSIMLAQNFKGDLPPEGYELEIAETKVQLNGRGSGYMYGLQTLLQLMQKSTNPGYATIPCALIHDNPRFSYRGMHLDVSRHFFDVDFIKRYIDLMAAYKLNFFHWHLTDDQGWRIEIKKYPKLTEVGSKRAQTLVGKIKGADADVYDNTPYGGFYTQDQILDVVTYAGERFITIIPEIEMPGHCRAMVAAYPEWSCDPTQTYKVAETWGEFKDVLCPNEETFKALKDILREVMLLFPGKYIHIGGDECPKDAWKKSEFCRQLIVDSALRDENGLQSYFIRTMERFVNSQGRSLIGWDEIMEGGLAPNASVMSWRGESGGIAAAQLGHDVIMTPGSGGLYFDHAQSRSKEEPLSIGGFAPLAKTYAYDPVPAALNKDQQKHILGVQANLWTEYIATTSKVEYMLLPRMLALSEIAWSPKANRNYKNFSEQRVAKHLPKLEAAGFNYRVPEPVGASDTLAIGDKFKIELTPLVEGAKIYFTIDGYQPRETDLLYTGPATLNIPKDKTIEFKTIAITPSGKRSVVNNIQMSNK